MITLKTLPQATEQEVFDQVATHLINQKVRSASQLGVSCYYRQDDLKCAAGCLISDDEYDVSIEGKAWSSLVYRSMVPSTHEDLITGLQEIQDCKKDEENFEDLLVEFAEQRGLQLNSDIFTS